MPPAKTATLVTPRRRVRRAPRQVALFGRQAGVAGGERARRPRLPPRCARSDRLAQIAHRRPSASMVWMSTRGARHGAPRPAVGDPVAPSEDIARRLGGQVTIRPSGRFAVARRGQQLLDVIFLDPPAPDLDLTWLMRLASPRAEAPSQTLVTLVRRALVFGPLQRVAHGVSCRGNGGDIAAA